MSCGATGSHDWRGGPQLLQDPGSDHFWHQHVVDTIETYAAIQIVGDVDNSVYR